VIGQIIAFKPRSQGGGSQLKYLAGEAHAPQFTDYHSKDALGVWRMGDGLEALGMSTLDPFSQEATRRLAEGFHAKTGAPLCRNAGAEHRQGWDITIDDPKDFSLIHAFGDEAAKRDYYEARREAWKIVVGEIQRLVQPKYAGHEGPVSIAMEIFEHDDSRAGDPHKHGHGFLFNVGVLPGGKTCAIDVSLVMAAKAYLGQVYQSELARQFAQRGRAVAFEDRESTDQRKKTRYATATIPGIATAEQLEAFSERSSDIAESLAKEGIRNTVKSKNAAALKSRDAKTLTRQELLAKWDQKAKAVGLDIEQLHRSLGGQASVELSNDEALERLVREIGDVGKKAVDGNGLVNEHEIAFAAARALRGCSLEAIKAAAEHIQKAMIAVEENRLGKTFTTQECLDLEARMKRQFAQMAQAAPANAIGQEAVDAASAIWEAKSGHKLTAEQRVAASHIVCGAGLLANIEGEAGTGKSTLMEVAAAAWKANGMAVIGAAPTGKAAEALAMSLGEAQTCAKMLLELQSGKLKLDAKTVLVIDECGMLATPAYSKLVNHAALAGAKLVCVGDRSQLAAIGMRGGFHAAIEAADMASITENRRQMKAKAVGSPIGKLFRQGKAAEALDMIEKEGRLSVASSESDIIKQLAAKWIADASAPMEKMVLAERVETVAELNAAIREARKQAGQIGEGQQVVLETKDGDKFSQELAEGDKILFLQNATKQSRVIDMATGQPCCPKNGVAAQIEEMLMAGEDSMLLTVRTEDGRRLQFETANYACFGLGYAHSIHKSQGSTATNVYAVAEGSQVADLGLAYVAATRHKNDCHMFVEEEVREAWIKRAQTLADARMVSEKLKGQAATPQLTMAQAAALSADQAAPKDALAKPAEIAAPARPIAAEPESLEAKFAKDRKAEIANWIAAAASAPKLVRQEAAPAAAKPAAPAKSPKTVAANVLSLEIARKLAAKHAKEESERGGKGKGSGGGRGATSPLKAGHAVAFEPGQRAAMDFGKAAQVGDLNAMRAVFQAGVDVDFAHQGWAAAHRAAIADKGDSIRLLVTFGADLDMPGGRHGMTPLMAAATKGRAAACQALLECGADAFAKDSSGQRASEIAEAQGHKTLAEFLRHYEAAFAAENERIAKDAAIKQARQPAAVEQVDGLKEQREQLRQLLLAKQEAQKASQQAADEKAEQERQRAMKSPNYIKPPTQTLTPRPPKPDLGLSR